MVFVHSRKDTGKTARMLGERAQNSGDAAVFDCSDQDLFRLMQKEIAKSRNRYV